MIAREYSSATMAKPRVLYLGFRVGYLNRTRELLWETLTRAADTVAFGPGFSTRADLERGPMAFVDRRGPFDFVVADEYALQQFDEARPQANRFVNHATRFDRGLLRMGIEFREFMRAAPMRRIVALLQTDYYNVRPEFVAAIDVVADHVLGWGEELIAPRAAAGRSAVPGGLDQRILAHWQDRYLDFARANAHRMISLPHVIADDEFDDRPLADRFADWSVLGANYDARLQATRSLESAGIGRSGRWIPYVHAAIAKAGINPYAHYWSIWLLQALFRRALAQARFGFTCGSAARMAVRKYFEIPAMGSVLVAEPCQGFGDLGFVDRVNAVACQGENVLEAHRWLVENPDRAQAIAAAGLRLVAERHSVAARARQIRAALDAIVAGDFTGSRWTDGNFIIRRNGTAARVAESSAA